MINKNALCASVGEEWIKLRLSELSYHHSPNLPVNANWRERGPHSMHQGSAVKSDLGRSSNG
jgi:hypothetical protein